MNNPWDSVPTLWKNEKAFLNWMRSQVRRIWNRHPVKNNYVRQRKAFHPYTLEQQGYEVRGATPRTKVARQCEMCGEWFAPSRLEVDHIHGGVGFSDYQGFIEWQHRILFVGFDDIREICKDCHHKVNTSQRYNIPIEQVAKQLELIAFKKLKAKQQKELLAKCELPSTGNSKVREEVFIQHLRVKYGY